LVRNNKGQFIKGQNIHDLTGKHFGLLTVKEIDTKRSSRKTYWICECECGNLKSIRSDCLGIVNSCGCLKKVQDNLNLLHGTNKHNLTSHVLFPVWNGMVYRCENPKSSAYKHYGGRGIKVCDEWHDVAKFIEWAEHNGYSDGLTIERKNVNGNYEPDNCTWITMYEQGLNKTNSVKITIDGVTKNLMVWAHELNIPQSKVWSAPSKGIPYEKLIMEYI
jgi:hypothetical protein